MRRQGPTYVALFLAMIRAAVCIAGEEERSTPCLIPNLTTAVVQDQSALAPDPLPSHVALIDRDKTKENLPEAVRAMLPSDARGSITNLLNGRGTFIENRGQFDPRVKYQLRAGGKTLWLTDTGLVFDVPRSDPPDRGTNVGLAGPVSPTAVDPNSSIGETTLSGTAAQRSKADFKSRQMDQLVFSEEFLGAHPTPSVEASKPEAGMYNYLAGNDPRKWHTHVRGYGEVLYHNLWDGIDLKLYGNGSDLEQEFVVHPGGDLTQVRVAYRGITGLQVEADGSLVVHTAFGELHETPPRIYQEIDGKPVPVKGRFKLTSETAYTFEVKDYNPQYALVIDPTLLYSTYLGGNANTEAFAITADAFGHVYVTGQTLATTFPTENALQPALQSASRTDAFVAKLDPTQSGAASLLYSTYLGGDKSDGGEGIAVDAFGSVYVKGTTASSNFPTTPGAFQPNLRGLSDAFVIKLNATGSALVYSTYLGGSGAELSPDLGGGGRRVGGGIAVDADGNAAMTGTTLSSDFPTTVGAFDRQCGTDGTCNVGGFGGKADVFVALLDPSGSTLVYATYLGGGGIDEASSVAIDPDGNIYVTGTAGSSDFPTKNALQPQHTENTSAFVSKIDPTQSGADSLVYSTYLGGSLGESGYAIAVDGAGNAYVTGSTNPPDFPTKNAAQPVCGSCGSFPDAFVTKLDTNASGAASLVYSTYLGGTGLSRGQ
jgi:hypothetical protein